MTDTGLGAAADGPPGMRFGLVGTGPWASMTHGPGLVAAPGADLVGVWGRDPGKTARLASSLGVPTYESYDSLLADVDAVAFAVPPAAQAELAVEAARAGKHLMLDKPVATDVGAARALRDAAAEAGVASVVFFTDRFMEGSRAWFRQAAETDGWRGGWIRWFSSLQEPDNPFGSSPWRHEGGALWDIGPHALSTLDGSLGPIDSVTAVAGVRDLVVLTLRHRSGAVSVVTLTVFAPPSVAGFDAAVWGESGVLPMPLRQEETFVDAFAAAVEELIAAAGGEPHPLDVAFGARVVELLADAQAQLDAQATRRS